MSSPALTSITSGGSGGSGGSGATPAAATPAAINAAKTLLGWTLILVLVAAISETRIGHVVIYYALVLAILVLLLGSYQEVVDILGAVRAPEGPSSGG